MREVTVTRQEYKNNGMESAPEMDMPAEKIYEQSVLKQKQRDQCYWMTVTASIKEHTSLFWGDIPQSAFLRTSTCCPPPSACTEAHGGAGHPPVLQRWSQGAPRLLQKVLSEIPQLSEHRQEALGLATALSFMRKPCAIQGPGFPNSTQ